MREVRGMAASESVQAWWSVRAYRNLSVHLCALESERIKWAFSARGPYSRGLGMGRARGVTGGRMGVVERSHRKGVGMGRLWGRRAVEGRAMGRRSRGAVLWGIKGSKRECAVVAASSRERRWLEWVQGEGQQAPPHCSPRGCCWWGWWRSIGLRSLVGRATLRWLPWSLQGAGG